MEKELLEKIKESLDITFEDNDFDKKIIGIIEDSIVVLSRLFGVEEKEIDWTKPGAERKLLKNYCLYELNNVSEQFNDAYRADIMAVRQKYEVKGWTKEDSINT